MSTGSMRLRRMGIGDVLDETFRLYRRHFLVFLLAMAVFVVPITVVPAAVGLAALGTLDFEALARRLQSSGAAVAAAIAAASVIVPYLLIAGLGYLLNMAAVVRLASDAILGRPLDVGACYQRALGDILPIFGLGLLMILGFPVVMALVGAAVVFTPPVAAAIIVLLAFLAAIPAWFYVYLGWSVTLQAIVLEGLGPLRGLARSWSLTEGSRWRILAVTLVLSILVSILGSIPGVVVQLAGDALIQARATPENLAVILSTTISLIAQTITQTIFGALTYIAMTVLYYELRVRKEAFDLEQLAQQPTAPARPGFSP